jgi:DnaJ-class molecular chaperone
MSERIISTQPCPVCHGTKRCGGEVCSNCNGTGNVPVYEEDRDYKPSED